jgi:Holliday junction resolvasome RuvABC endonuclease subunit
MENILALDAASKTGWSHTLNPGGVFELPKPTKGESVGRRMVFFWDWLTSLLSEYQTDVIVYEQAHHRGGAATRIGVGLVTVIEMAAYTHECRVLSCHTSTLKKHATGCGRAEKYQMRAAAEAMNPTIEIVDDNHTDALWLLDWAQSN